MNKDYVGKSYAGHKGRKITYWGIHVWVKKHLPKTKLCESCNQRPAYDVANISQEYKRDLSDWEWLCRSCHMKKDGRLKTFLSHRKSLDPQMMSERAKRVFSKKVLQKDLDGNVIATFYSIREAGRVLGIDNSYLARACKSPSKKAKGFKWSYASI